MIGKMIIDYHTYDQNTWMVSKNWADICSLTQEGYHQQNMGAYCVWLGRFLWLHCVIV